MSFALCFAGASFAETNQSPSRDVPSDGFAAPYSVTPSEPEEAKDIRVADAHVDRVILLPTAETHPRGSVVLTANEIVAWQLSYAITDHIQATVTTAPVLLAWRAFLADGSFKANLLRRDVLRVGAAVGFGYAKFGLGTFEDTPLMPHGALMLELCAPKSCALALTGAAGALGVEEGSMFMAGLGLNARFVQGFSALAEVSTVGRIRGNLSSEQGLLLNVGLRAYGESFALDMAIIHVDEEVNLPWGAFSYRFGSVAGEGSQTPSSVW